MVTEPQKIEINPLDENIVRGVAWLDGTMPSWWMEGYINLEALDISTTLCVLFQLNLQNRFSMDVGPDAEDWYTHGFSGHHRGAKVGEAYETELRLTQKWREVIINRRAA